MDGMWERSAATNTAELLTGRKGGGGKRWRWRKLNPRGGSGTTVKVRP